MGILKIHILYYLCLMLKLSRTSSPFNLDDAAQKTRKFRHSPEELLLIHKVTPEIAAPGCMSHPNITQNLVMVVNSVAVTTGEYYDRRMMTRETWMKDAKKRNIHVIFAIGLPNDTDTQLQLIEEQRDYGDMVQFQFIDAYYNLTLKAIAVLNWLNKHCSMIKYVAKMDDDIFVNIERLVQILPEIKRGITGRYTIRGDDGEYHPARDPKSRYYIPISVFPDESYPNTICGFFYIMSGDILESMSLMAATWSEIVLYLEDVYITGIIAEALGINRTKHEEVVFRETTGSGCSIGVQELETVIAFHGCETARDYAKLYTDWKEAQNVLQDTSSVFLIILILLLTIVLLIVVFFKRRLKVLLQRNLQKY